MTAPSSAPQARVRKPNTSSKASMHVTYLLFIFVVGLMLLCASYQVNKASEQRASLRVETLHSYQLPVAASKQSVGQRSATEGPPMTFSRCVNKDHIALTFDDGPNELTLALLNLFEKHDVQATFFFVGVNLELDETNRRATKLAFERGHQVASHLWSHPRMADLDAQQIRSQLQQNSDALQAITGHRPRYMRPPYGSTSDLVDATIFAESYKSMLWSCDSNDWRLTREADVTEYINRCSLDGMVLLLHEGRQSTIDAVEKFILRVRAKHPEKKFVRADECSGYPGDADVEL